MKAAVVGTPGKFEFTEVGNPVCADDGVLVRIRAATICASDIKRSLRDDLPQPRPYILGEESAGEIVQLGARVRKWKVGDRVALTPRLYCGQCEPCRLGHTNICRNVRGIGFHIPGGFAEYCAVPGGLPTDEILTRVPDGLPFEAAALAEPLACAFNGVEMAGVCKGDDVVIIGMGAQGVMQAQLAKHFGARSVIGVMRSARRSDSVRRCARSLDELVIQAERDAAEAVKRRVGQEGASVVIVSASSGDALKLALELVRCHGRICIHASIPAGEQLLQADANRLHYEEITITGSSSFKQAQYVKAMGLLHQRVVDWETLIGARLPLAEVERGVAMMKNREALKVALNP